MDTHALGTALARLARSHVWTWSWELRTIFEDVSDGRPIHPAALVAGLSPEQLESVASDPRIVARIQHQLDALDQLMTPEPGLPDIAYFSPEFGISELVPQYSGGLGILAGDHVKAASDLALPLCGVGLFYRQGFFRQDVTDGAQSERYQDHDPAGLGAVDSGLVVSVPIASREVRARVWLLTVGRVSLVLLDTDLAVNATKDRGITDRLYGGDRRHRIEQELVLGVGGARALAALGWHPGVHHLNEGHAGFLLLELLDREIAAGASLAEARQAVRPHVVFTTHTPVPAGIDRFSDGLATRHLQPWADAWDVPVTDLTALGADPATPDEAFNMAIFCLESATRTNGVSKLHGTVSRELFSQVPSGAAIGSITNGVHARTWTARHLQDALDDRVGPAWADGDRDAWEQVGALPDEVVSALRREGSTVLTAFLADRVGVHLDPDALTIGFARRFATYKRANLLLLHRARLEALLADDERPVQFVFAGKAHPADEPGKKLLSEIVSFGRSRAANGRFVFVPDYEMAVARAMYAGCDVWLNTPIRPHEACGTSGEKAALNGGLNCSISDGWWDEMADDRNGWTIPESSAGHPTDRDRAESQAAIEIISSQIVPTYYSDDAPRSGPWLDRVRHCWESLGPKVTAARMVRDYRDQLYQPTLDELSDGR